MHTILNAADYEQMLARVNALQPDDRARWGRMTVNEALCHVTDVFRMALGEIRLPDRSNKFMRAFLKPLVLLGIPAPKGKIKTDPELDQSQGKGTRPTTFDQDKRRFQEYFAAFFKTDAAFSLFPHPQFGQLTKAEWGRLLFLHTNHHLTQFGR